METVIRRRWQGGEEAELMTVKACFIRDASRTVSPPSGLCSNTPHQSPLVRTPLPLPPPATACNLDDTFSLKKFAKKRFHPANGCSETFSSGHLSSPSSAASSKLEKTTVKKRREGLTCVSCCCCSLLLLLQGSVIAATAALLPEADSVFFFSKEDQKTTTTKQKQMQIEIFSAEKMCFHSTFDWL